VSWLGGGLSASLLAIATLATLAAQVLVLKLLGPGAAMDGFVASLIVPMILTGVLSSAIVNVVTPVLLPMNDRQRRAAGRAIVLRWGVLAGGVCGLIALAAGLCAGLLFPGFDEQRIGFVRDLSPWAAASLWASLVTAVLLAYLRAERRYVVPELIGALAGLLLVAALPLAVPRYGVTAAAVLFAARSILNLIATAWLSRGISGGSAVVEVPSLFSRLGPLLGGGGVHKLSPLVDGFLLSHAPPGDLSVFSVFTRIVGAAMQLLERALIMPWAPQISTAVAAADPSHLAAAYRRRIIATTAIVASGAALLMLAGHFVIGLLLGMPADRAEVSVAFQIAVALIGMALGAGLGQCAAAISYGVGATRDIARATIISFAASLVLKPGLLSLWGVAGVAAATSLQYLIMFALLANSARGQLRALTAARRGRSR
jgi:O-antigen/teichoic acid export membrane protein